jgi:predicted dehydrogenase
MTKRVRIALVGTGKVSELHARASRRVPNAQLVGVWSQTESNVQQFAERHNIVAFRSLEQLLSESSVDAVAVLTTTPTHYNFAIKCLEAGKHVLVEKPVAASQQQFETLRRTAVAVNRLCMPSHNYLYDPVLREAKQHVDDGELGRISSFWVIYNLQQTAELVGPDILTKEVMIHHVYTMLAFVGRPKRVSAASTNVWFADGISPDQTTAMIEHDSGVISNLWASFGATDYSSSPWTVIFKVIGTNGSFQRSWNDIYLRSQPVSGWEMGHYHDSFFHVQNHFVNHCLLAGEPPLSTLNDALDAWRIIEAIERSAASGERITLDFG